MPLHPDIKKINAERRLQGYPPLNKYQYQIEKDSVVALELKEKDETKLPSIIFNISSLLVLRLGNFSFIPEDINRLENLRILELERFRSSTLPSQVTDLRKLEVLIISRSDIQSLPTRIINMPNLRDIDLINNAMRHLPEIILDLPSLKFLSIAGFEDDANNLGQKLTAIGSLEKLFIGKMKKEVFPELWYYISKLKNLTHLSISGFAEVSSELHTIPPLINNLQNLESLWLDGEIRCFPDIPDLHNLEELYLFSTPTDKADRKVLKTKKGFCYKKNCELHQN